MTNIKTALLVVTIMFLLAIVGFSKDSVLINDLTLRFRKFNLVRLDSAAELAKARLKQDIIIKVDGRDLALSLVENDMRAPNYQ